MMTQKKLNTLTESILPVKRMYNIYRTNDQFQLLKCCFKLMFSHLLKLKHKKEITCLFRNQNHSLYVCANNNIFKPILVNIHKF